MANMVLPNEGLTFLLEYWIGKTANSFSDWLLGIYTNSGYTPSPSSVFADLTFASWSGYAPITLTKATWLSATIASNKAFSTWGSTPVTWTVGSSPPTVQGWAIYTPSASKLVALQQLVTPIVTATGGILSMLPRLEFLTEP
jgi:hypothetical protein